MRSFSTRSRPAVAELTALTAFSAYAQLGLAAGVDVDVNTGLG